MLKQGCEYTCANCTNFRWMKSQRNQCLPDGVQREASKDRPAHTDAVRVVYASSEIRTKPNIASLPFIPLASEMSVSLTADSWPLATRMLPRLWAFAFRLCGDAAMAEKLVEDAYCFGNFDASAAEQSVSAPKQLYARVYLGWVTRRWGAGGNEPLPLTCLAASRGDAGGSSCANACELIEHTRLVNAVNALPDIERAVVLLIAVDELSVKATAEIIGTSPAKVIAHLNAAEAMMDIAIGGTRGRPASKA
jgi:RNA polymerase sigma-70 factor (ECF subfamily)